MLNEVFQRLSEIILLISCSVSFSVSLRCHDVVKSFLVIETSLGVYNFPMIPNVPILSRNSMNKRKTARTESISTKFILGAWNEEARVT